MSPRHAAPPDPAAVARAQAAVAHVESAIRARGLREFRCHNAQCNAKHFEYRPPIGEVSVKCRRCGLYSVLTTETPA